jgi:excisionase family DNA binding protein
VRGTKRKRREGVWELRVYVGRDPVTGAVAPVEDRLVLTVDEAARWLGISRPFAYESVQRGDIPSGKRILVPKAALQRFLEQPENRHHLANRDGDSSAVD